jgi:hypothetical protein
MADTGAIGFSPIISGATSVTIPFTGSYFMSYGFSLSGVASSPLGTILCELQATGNPIPGSAVYMASNWTLNQQSIISQLNAGDVITMNNISMDSISGTTATLFLDCFTTVQNPSSTTAAPGFDVTAYLNMILIGE